MRTLESAAIRLCVATSPLPYVAVPFAGLCLAGAAVLAILALYCAVCGAVVCLLLLPLYRRAGRTVRNLALRSARGVEATACRVDAVLARMQERCYPQAVPVPTATVFVPSPAVAPHECPPRALPIPVALAVPVAKLLPTEARRVALPVCEAPASLADLYPSLESALPSDYSPCPVLPAETTDDLLARLTSLRSDLSARCDSLADSFAPALPATEPTYTVAACPAASDTPAAPLAPLSYREMQAECKRRGLPAKGSAAVLRERLGL